MLSRLTKCSKSASGNSEYVGNEEKQQCTHTLIETAFNQSGLQFSCLTFCSYDAVKKKKLSKKLYVFKQNLLRLFKLGRFSGKFATCLESSIVSQSEVASV